MWWVRTVKERLRIKKNAKDVTVSKNRIAAHFGMFWGPFLWPKKKRYLTNCFLFYLFFFFHNRTVCGWRSSSILFLTVLKYFECDDWSVSGRNLFQTAICVWSLGTYNQSKPSCHQYLVRSVAFRLLFTDSVFLPYRWPLLLFPSFPRKVQYQWSKMFGLASLAVRAL